MNTLNRLFVVALLVATGFMVQGAEEASKIASQLDVYETPETFVFDHGNGLTTKLVPHSHFVVLFSSNKAELATALKNPERFMDRLPEESKRHVVAVPFSALKSVEELRALAEEGKLPIIHRGYMITENIRAPVLLLPTGLIQVKLNDAADAGKLEGLARSLGLVEAKFERSLGANPPASPTTKIFELAGKSKYNFVFDVARQLGKASFVEEARPVAPILTRNPAERRAPPREETPREEARGEVKEIESADQFTKEVTEHKGLVVVDFYANWCPPCRLLAPVLKEFAQANAKDIKVVKVNVEKIRSPSSTFDVRSIPTLIFFKNGKEIKRVVGFRTLERLQEIFDKLQK